ncbi:MAG: hypothetical protein BWX99_01732 [Deltaproteobacteria bacterium ADurb.Bin151]|nr:MAG: hypothetical protein BWX99_01732 [Deltaproteobacteria bacterium ADurb.Bin151]
MDMREEYREKGIQLCFERHFKDIRDSFTNVAYAVFAAVHSIEPEYNSGDVRGDSVQAFFIFLQQLIRFFPLGNIACNSSETGWLTCWILNQRYGSLNIFCNTILCFYPPD